MSELDDIKSLLKEKVEGEIKLLHKDADGIEIIITEEDIRQDARNQALTDILKLIEEL